MNGRRTDREKKLYEDKIISIGKVTKVTQGGRNFRFVDINDRSFTIQFMYNGKTYRFTPSESDISIS